MKIIKTTHSLLFLALLSFGFVCGDDKSSDSVDETLDELARLINEEIGTPTALEASECRSIAFGSKPCGGPWSYRVYSTSVSDEERLTDLVLNYNDIESQLNQAEGRTSDCSVVIKPHLELENGLCFAVE